MNPPSGAGPGRSTDAWLERFWRHVWARRPVDATFAGVRGHDHALPAFDESGAGDTLSELRALLTDTPDLGPGPGGASPERGDDGAPTRSARGAPPRTPRELDLVLARTFLEIQVAEHESGHLLDNPSVHVGEAVFGMMSLLFRGSTPTRDRAEALRARVAAVPDALTAATARVRPCHPAWIARARRECRGALAFLRDGLEHVDVAFGPERAAAIDAFERFADGLGRPVPRAMRPGETGAGRAGPPLRSPACGPELFDLLLRRGHFLDRGADELLAGAREALEVARARLETEARALGHPSPGDALLRVGDVHPDPDGYYDRFTRTWAEMRGVAERHDLVTWPDHPIRYVARPAWARAAAPDLYFLFYRSPAAHDTPPVHDYLVSPLEPSLEGEALEAFLRANNDAVIKLNHVVHHGGLGHHVQNAHARRSALEVGRVAAVDGACRIVMFCGGSMAEGWACYATDLMAEVGALTPLERLSEAHARVRMCARAVADVELHHGRMSLEDASAWYRDIAGMPPAAAEAEAVKTSMFPGTALMYLAGTDAIHELRADVMRRAAGTVSLRALHDALLSYGSAPVALVAEEIRRRQAAGRPLALDLPDPSLEAS